MKLTADGRGTAIEHPGDGSLTQALELAKLGRDAFFNTDLLIRHAYTVPDCSGVELSLSRCLANLRSCPFLQFSDGCQNLRFITYLNDG